MAPNLNRIQCIYRGLYAVLYQNCMIHWHWPKFRFYGSFGATQIFIDHHGTCRVYHHINFSLYQYILVRGSSSTELYFLVWLQHILHEVIRIENYIFCVDWLHTTLYTWLLLPPICHMR